MHGSRKIRAIIVGGGIGGLTAAVALLRAGFDVALFEKAIDVKQVWVGGGIHAWHNAMRALQKIGMAEQVEAAGSVVERVEFSTASGRIVATWPVAQITQQVGAPAVGLSRADLLQVLGGALESGVVHPGVAFTTCEQDNTGATVRFSDGREERCDILVGADGARSDVRKQCSGTIELRAAGYAVWGGIVDFDRSRITPGVLRLMYKRGSRFSFYRVGQGGLCWTGTANIGPGDPDPAGDPKTFLLKVFRGWQDPVEEMIQATDEAMIRRRDMFALPTLERWGSGRVTLLGDSAHAMTSDLAQGAGQAIEDAVVLVDCLREGGDVIASLRAYEARRRARTARLQNAAWRVGQMNRWENPLTCAIRLPLMALLLRGPVLTWLKRSVRAEF